MTWRTGHGAMKGSGPRIEVMPADELPPASPSITAKPPRGPDGKFLPGNREQRYGLVRPGPRGFTAALKVDKHFSPFAKWGRRYASHRRAELAKAHGGELSAGVSALIESAGAQLAASRFVQAKASETGDTDLFKKASMLANDARQNELAAWELAAREAKAREERNDAPDPWEKKNASSVETKP